MKPYVEKIAIIGAGRLGRSLARALCEVGGIVAAVHDIDRRRARSCVALCGSQTRASSLSELPADLTLIFLTVPDDAVSECAAALAQLPLSEDCVVAHTSGALPSDALDPLRGRTRLLASLHPVQTFSGAGNDWKRLFDIYFGFEGYRPVLTRLRPLVKKMGGEVFIIPKRHKGMYHIGCVFASNFLVSVLSAATEVLQVVGFDQEQAIRIFEPLSQATLDNVKRHGTAGAATGPITRGDLGTVSHHLSDLNRCSPQLLALYRTLAGQLCDLMEKVHGAEKVKLEQIRRLLGNGD